MGRLPRSGARSALALLGLAAVAAPLPLLAQRQLHTVRGVVRDTTHRPLSGAEVVQVDGGRRSTTTGADGRFTLDSVPSGRVTLVARRVGYLPAPAAVSVPQSSSDSLVIMLSPRAMILQEIVVEGTRRGIYGVVGDTAHRALEGVSVALIRGHETGTTDSMGRFAFPDLKPGAYALSVSHPEFRGRMISVLVPDRGGKEYSILLLPREPGQRDWSDSRVMRWALAELDARLPWTLERNRVTAEELRRYGGSPLCEVTRIRVRGHPTPLVAIDGHNVLPEGTTLCAWNADEVELVEFGDDPCRDDSHTLPALFKQWCGGRRSASFTAVRAPRLGYVVIWLRR